MCVQRRLSFYALLIALCFLTIVLRIPALMGDLWMDEIWSLNISQEHRYLHQILFFVNHDNNHPLNTAFLWLWGKGHSEWVYRLHSVAGAVVTVFFVVRILLLCSSNQRTPFWGGTFTAFSFALVNYGSEARGYALAMGFLSWATYVYLFTHHCAISPYRSRWRNLVLFNLLASLSHMAHLSALFVLIALLITHTRRLFLKGLTLYSFVPFLTWHAPWILFFNLRWWVLGLRHMEIGGGSGGTPLQSVAEGLVLYISPLFLDLSPWGEYVAALMILFLLLFWLYVKRHDSIGVLSPRYALQSITLCAFVIGTFVVLMKDYVYAHPRYLVVLLPFALCLLSLIVEDICFTASHYFGGLFSRRLFWVLLFLVVTLQVPDILRLYVEQRGQYKAAIQEIVDSSFMPKTPVPIASDHRFRVGIVLDYYGPPKAVHAPASERTRFAIAILPEGSEEFKERLFTHGQAYSLNKQYPCSRLSGHQWAVYEHR